MKNPKERGINMKDLKTLKIGLLGYGTVGTGVYKLVESQKEEMPHKIGANLSVAKILVRDKTKKRDGIAAEPAHRPF